jgi:nucleotidyltransferase/DNA polymerase involved in DNA repair
VAAANPRRATTGVPTSAPTEASASALPPQHWDERPRALTNGSRLRVVSLAAGRAGVRAGMTIAEAKARCADLEVRPWDAHAIDDAILAATTALLAASPQVTPASGSPGMWWVGATGFEALGGETQLAHTLLTIAQQWHPDARVAIADTCVAARAATWAPVKREAEHRHIIVIPPHGCARYLAPAPLGLVPMSEELRDALRMLGLTTVGALAALDAGDVEQRWSAEGLLAWRLARGHDPRRPGLVRVDAVRSASVELPGAVESAEPILFVLRAQLQRLLQQCVHDGRAAAAVAITLVLDAGRQYPLEDIGSEMQGHRHVPETSEDVVPALVKGRKPEAGRREQAAEETTASAAPRTTSTLLGIPQRTITREVRPARPLARLEPLFDQCRALLERWPIPAPVIGVTVSIPATAPLAADQGDLLVPSWRDAAMNADAVFARLRAVLDPDNRGDVVVHPEARDTHRPEETGLWTPADAITLASAPLPVVPASVVPVVPTPVVPAPAPRASAVPAVPPPAPPAVLRLLPAPDPVDVELPHGTPAAIWWRGRRVDLAAAHGPERLSGDWWRGDGYARDYWRCTAPTDGDLLLYHTDGGWYLQGWFD